MNSNFNITALVITILLTVVSSCTKSHYDKVNSYLDELSTEVVSSTTEEEFNVSYRKVIELKENDLMVNLSDLSHKQKQEILCKVETLTMKTLAVKAVLYVLPKDIKPTVKDMEYLTNEILKRELDLISFPFSDVGTLVNKYYSAKNRKQITK